jgi:hypothetical protein
MLRNTHVLLTVKSFIDAALDLVFGADVWSLLQRTERVLQASRIRGDMRKEFAILCAQNVLWLFAHIHSRWLVKSPHVTQQQIEGSRFLIGIRHFGDTHVVHTPMSESSISEYLDAHFQRVGGDLALLLRQFSLCELVYFMLMCVYHHGREQVRVLWCVCCTVV